MFGEKVTDIFKRNSSGATSQYDVIASFMSKTLFITRNDRKTFSDN